MKKSVASVLLTVIASLASVLAVPHTSFAAVANWQQGALMQSRSQTDFASSSYQQSIDRLAATGANYVALVVPVYQDNPYSTSIQYGWSTPTDQALASGIQYAKSKGLNVAISLHDNNNDGQWRAFINPGDRAGWFASYGAILNRLATIAQTNGANEMVLGTELVSMTDPNRNPSNTQNWQSLIAQVRARFSGILTYSAQHSGDISDSMTLGFWPQLDKIGLSAYYGLGYDSSVPAIKAQWDKWNNQYVNVLAQRYGKEVVFTEVGYQSKSNALADPGSAYNMGGGVDLTLQANAYQALMEYWNNYGYMNGVFWWDWNSDPNYGGAGNNDYSPQNKPAENIMKQWFAGSGPAQQPGSGGGQPTPTPVPSVDPSTATYKVSLANKTGTAGGTISLDPSLAADKAVSGLIVDVEVYASNGSRVYQKFYSDQALSSTPKVISDNWPAGSTGTYTVKVGIFTANWQKNLYWNDSLATITVGASTPTPPPVPTPVPTPTPNPTPTPTPTPASNTLSIWWPSDGSSVSGTQPFKASLDGVALNRYRLYWQVDNGSLNEMGDSQTDAPHKESLVNLAPWTWNASGTYTVNFVAKDLTGAIITNKAVNLRVTH